MQELYPNTPIIETTPSIAYLLGQIAGNVILPIAAVLWVVLYFQGKPQMKLYILVMVSAFVLFPSWLVLVIATLLILSDKIEEDFRRKHGRD